MTPDEQQRAIRRRTIEAQDSNTKDNPVTIEMPEVATGEFKVDERRQRMRSIEAQRKGLTYKNSMKRNKVTSV